MRVFVTGDKHGSLQLCDVSPENWPEGQKLTKEDMLIIAGDFGAVFFGDDRDTKVLDFWESQPYTILFIDGNHENFDLLDKYPVEEWHGGKVHFIRESIIHLMRGQIYYIGGKSFFTIGGATSVDKDRRIPGVSWWPQELPTFEELETAQRNLNDHNNCVDYIITHCCSVYQFASFSHQSPFEFNRDLLTDYLGEWDHGSSSITFKHWFYGHWHQDLQVDDTHTMLCRSVVEIPL